jgi:hypothetical protein
MKKFRTVIVALLAVTLAAPLAFSQAGGNKEEVMAKLEKISAELQLTPAQKKQMLPILKDEAPKLQALKSDTTLGPLQKAMKMKEIANDTDTKVKPILNPEQYQKWEQMRAQERQQMMQKMENKG